MHMHHFLNSLKINREEIVYDRKSNDWFYRNWINGRKHGTTFNECPLSSTYFYSYESKSPYINGRRRNLGRLCYKHRQKIRHHYYDDWYTKRCRRCIL